MRVKEVKTHANSHIGKGNVEIQTKDCPNPESLLFALSTLYIALGTRK